MARCGDDLTCDCLARAGILASQRKDDGMDDDKNDLPPAARSALAEAEERRRKSAPPHLPPELGGRDGPEPVRFGDWERRGIAIDF